MLANDDLFNQAQSTKTGSQLSVLAVLERIFVVIGIFFFANFIVFLLVGVPPERPTAIVTDPGPLARMSWYPLYLGLLLVSAARWRSMLRALSKIWPIALLFLLAVVSIKTSIDSALTQRRVIALFFTILFGVYLAARAPIKDTLQLIGIAWLGMSLINLFTVFALPQIGVHSELHVGAWRGVLGEKNLMGGDSARANLIFLALLFYDKTHWRTWLFGLIITFLLVIGSTSKTSLIALLAPYAIYAFYEIGRRSKIMGLLAIWGGASCAGLVLFVVAAFPEQLVALIGKDLTFTGRTEIWALVLNLMQKVPWTGYGYAAFWIDPLGPSVFIRDVLDWEVPTAHNGWLEVGLSLGYPGLYTLALMTFLALFKGVWLSGGKHGPFPFLIVFQIVLFSLSESLLMEQNTHATALFFFGVSYCLIAKRQSHTSDETPLEPPRWALPARTNRRRGDRRRHSRTPDL